MPANMQNVIYEEVPQSIQQGGVYEKTIDRSEYFSAVHDLPAASAGSVTGERGRGEVF